jgi:hypothetical protein
LPGLAEALQQGRATDQLLDAGVLAGPRERDRHQGNRLDRRPPGADAGDEARPVQGHQRLRQRQGEHPETSTNISVDRYAIPPAAPQAGSAATLDTLDARFTQAVGAIDPNHDEKFAIWTQHAIAGGAGSRVRWYEIDPSKPKVLQKDSASSSSLYEFNGAISPNRQVSGSTARGGANMLMNFSSSSAATFPAIRIVSKKGSKPQSPQAVVLGSPGPLAGFDCSMPEADATCRWGDYASATPDPKDKSKIWNVNQWASGDLPACTTSTDCAATWRSQNFIASP